MMSKLRETLGKPLAPPALGMQPRGRSKRLLTRRLALGATVLTAVVALPATNASARTGARGYVMVQPAPAAPQPAVGTRILYLNRYGGTFTPGYDSDARTNVTGLVDSPSVISPFQHGDAKWNEVVQCVKSTFAPFDLTITEEDPGNQPHMEAVIAGSATEIGETNDIAGIALMNDDCSVIEGAVTLTFANLMTDVDEICWTAAQEAAHSLGLDHSMNCSDPMTYDVACGYSKRFQDSDSACGEYSARSCMCGGATQNSKAYLLGILGPSTGGDGTGTGDDTGNGDGSGNGDGQGPGDGAPNDMNPAAGEVVNACSVGGRSGSGGGLGFLLCMVGVFLRIRRRERYARNR